jgi:hypothetical protein
MTDIGTLKRLFDTLRARARWLRLQWTARLVHCPAFTIDNPHLPIYAELRIFSEAYVPAQGCAVCGEPILAYVRYVATGKTYKGKEILRHETPADFRPHLRER